MLADDLIVNVNDHDYTYQAFPEFDVSDPVLTFWEGDDIAGMLSFVGYDKYPLPFPAYLKQFIAAVRLEAKQADFSELPTFESAGGFEVSPYQGTLDDGEDEYDVLYYFYPAPEGYRVVMCVVFIPESIDDMRMRMGAVMQTARAE